MEILVEDLLLKDFLIALTLKDTIVRICLVVKIINKSVTSKPAYTKELIQKIRMHKEDFMNSKLLKRGFAIYVIVGSIIFPGLVTSVQAREVIGDYCNKKIETSVERYLKPAVHTRTVARVTAHVLNVRQGQGTDTPVINQVILGSKQRVIGENQDGWIPIQVGEQQGYVYSRYVELEQESVNGVSEGNILPEEEPQEEKQEESVIAQGDINIEDTSLNEAKLDPIKAQEVQGQAVIDYACQFIGNPYVWGGTDLENGADCSGFVQSVYRHFGVDLPRTSGEQRGAGVEVAYEEAIPGDIICYEGHVGLYMGDGQIVNAIGRKYGIDISSATHKKILSVRRVL